VKRPKQGKTQMTKMVKGWKLCNSEMASFE